MIEDDKIVPHTDLPQSIEEGWREADAVNNERPISDKLKTIEGVARTRDASVREAKIKEAEEGNPYPHKLRD